MNIKGNDRADEEAAKGLQLPLPDAPPTLAAVRAPARRKARHLFEQWWRANRPRSYRRLNLGIPHKRKPPELTLPRGTLHRLLAERLGHGDFAEYHDRFGHEPAGPCRCGEPKTAGH